MASRSPAYDAVGRPDDRGRRRGRAVRADLRARPGGLQPRLHASLLGEPGLGHRRPPDPDRDRRRGDHRRRPRVLDHDRRARPWRRPSSGRACCATSCAIAARRQRSEHSSRRSCTPCSHSASVSHSGADVRSPPVDHDRARPPARRSRRAHLLHPPHRDLDPAPPGHRRYRAGSFRGDLERDRDQHRRTGHPARERPVRAGAARSHRAGGRSRSRDQQRVPAVRRVPDARRHRDAAPTR